jgi:hypothetical protein
VFESKIVNGESGKARGVITGAAMKPEHHGSHYR